jgi:bifunctional non-homologous end joining protein LigD
MRTPVAPMLASTGEAPLDSPDLAYEPKYDGIRAIAVTGPRDTTLWSRLGNQKTSQFPEIVDALEGWAASRDQPAVLDGEIVALDGKGQPTGFQNLQGRIHVKGAPAPGAARTAFIVFDLLFDGAVDLRPLPLRERRARLERLLKGVHDDRLRLSEQVLGNGQPMYDLAKASGWEGLIAKRLDSIYKSGRRSPDWRKLKLVRHQTCVVGGWTEPRGTRPFFGALLLGVHDADGGLRYIGHTGAGFTDAELGHVWKQLQSLRTKQCPFSTVPKTNEKPHWTKPRLVIEVKFTEWTADGKLRHPTYLGMRDDVKAGSVSREPDISRPAVRASVHRAQVSSAPRHKAAESNREATVTKASQRKLLDQLDAIESDGGDGVLDLPGGHRLDVSNLQKVFWPVSTATRLQRGRAKATGALTKGDLFRHYVRVAPALLPALADRPLVMKRHPNGVTGKPFYQHRAPDKVPAGVRVAMVNAGSEQRPHLVGGDLMTLLYTAQLASISQDPWFSRVGSEDIVDHVAIDLDPPDGLPFGRVLDVALWVRDELAALKAVGFPKTSGSGGLHIYIPMPAGTPYDAGLLYCQIVANLVANKHPKFATVERSIAARGKRIYVDYLQNIQGKTLASAFSPRANDFAGVSTPLTWKEVESGVTPQDFTVANVAERLAAVGDLWAALRKAKGVDLRAVARVTKS